MNFSPCPCCLKNQLQHYMDLIKDENPEGLTELLRARKNALTNQTKEKVVLKLPRFMGSDGYATYEFDGSKI